MAKTVKTLPATKRKNARYPWSKWTNGKAWQCNPGKEFGVTAKTFRHYVIVHANRHGLTVQTRVSGDVVSFQFTKNTKGK